MSKVGLISVIVPVYNAEKYIDGCIKSIVNQTYNNIEILLIDDGSKDNSSQKCDKWASEDGRITLIHKQNGGVSSARNLGIDNAKGEFIAFVDADDWLERDYLSLLIEHINGCDLVVSGYKASGFGSFIVKSVDDGIIGLDQLRCDYDYYLKNDLINPPFAKLFRREIIDKQRFDEGLSLGEDIAFNLQYLAKCSDICFLSEALYNYNIGNITSASKRLRDKDFEQIYEIYLQSKEFVYKKGIIDFDEIDKRYCLNVIGLLQLLFYSNRTDKYKTADLWISSKVFNECCRGKYGFSMINKIPQYLCRYNMKCGIAIFFKIKKIVRNIIQ